MKINKNVMYRPLPWEEHQARETGFLWSQPDHIPREILSLVGWRGWDKENLVKYVVVFRPLHFKADRLLTHFGLTLMGVCTINIKVF